MDSLEDFLGSDFYNGLLEPVVPLVRSESPDFGDIIIVPPCIKLGQATFTIQSDCQVLVQSVKAQECVWSVEEMLAIFSYMLSPLCKPATSLEAKKKGMGSHPRSSYATILCDTLYVKWIQISHRWFMQVDRYTLKDLDGVPNSRARFNKTVLRQLEKTDLTRISQKLCYPERPDLPPEFQRTILDTVVFHLQAAKGTTFDQKQRYLLGHSKYLASDVLFKLSYYSCIYSLGFMPSLDELINDVRLELWYTLAQATG
jgi:hypothetical protein